MAMMLDDLKSLVKEAGIRYYVDEEHSALLIGYGGLFGSYHFVMVLDMDGEFVQFRTVDGYLECPRENASLFAVLQTLGSLNYKKRLVKFAWDPSDGEIVAYADAWLMDNRLTGSQLQQMVGTYLAIIDKAFKRLRETIETGVDPGEVDEATIEAAMRARSGTDEPDGDDPGDRVLVL